MPEDKRKINCWIPVSLYDKIGSSGYENTTQAIITALQRLLENPSEDTKGSNEDIEEYIQDIAALTAENAQLKEDLSGHQKDIAGYKKDLERIQKDLGQDITGYKEDIKALQDENAKLKYSLQESREPGELLQLRARS
jgi:predicted RNase H-like nuclease (RuvC/YqgF family)